MGKISDSYVIQYFYLKVLSPNNIKAKLDSTLRVYFSLLTTVKYWVAEFKQGRKSCQDEHGSGRPNEMTTPKMVNKIHKMILDDRLLKIHELANMVDISNSAMHCILTENLDIRKLCSRGCHVCSQWNKNSVMKMFQLSAW